MANESLSAPFVSDEQLLSAVIRARNLINEGKWKDAGPILAEACRKAMCFPAPPDVPISLNLSENNDAYECRKLAWEEVKRLVGAEKWTVGDSGNYYGFYCWGWDMRRQYNEQRAPSAPDGWRLVPLCRNR